jgi:hypothetical protein
MPVALSARNLEYTCQYGNIFQIFKPTYSELDLRLLPALLLDRPVLAGCLTLVSLLSKKKIRSPIVDHTIDSLFCSVLGRRRPDDP